MPHRHPEHPVPLRFHKETREGGRPAILVLAQGALVGRILQDPTTGRFRFFRGEHNRIAYSLEHRALSALKEMLQTEPGQDEPARSSPTRPRRPRPATKPSASAVTSRCGSAA